LIQCREGFCGRGLCRRNYERGIRTGIEAAAAWFSARSHGDKRRRSPAAASLAIARGCPAAAADSKCSRGRQ
jgi:hypothetical protein